MAGASRRSGVSVDPVAGGMSGPFPPGKIRPLFRLQMLGARFPAPPTPERGDGAGRRRDDQVGQRGATFLPLGKPLLGKPKALGRAAALASWRAKEGKEGAARRRPAADDRRSGALRGAGAGTE